LKRRETPWKKRGLDTWAAGADASIPGKGQEETRIIKNMFPTAGGERTRGGGTKKKKADRGKSISN